jgi:uncharacterized protein YodC (DUF2158 family)
MQRFLLRDVPVKNSSARILSMAVIKPGDLVVLKSGGPTMTVDTVNTDIFDDDKITGVLCVWFVGDKLERVRFDHRAIERVHPGDGNGPEEATGDYKLVLDEMVAAMNIPADAGRDAAKIVARQPRSVPRPKRAAATSPASDGVGTIP